MTEFYPMPMFVKLSVSEVKASVEWYRRVLEFEPVYELPGEAGATAMAHLRGSKYQDLMLVQGEAGQPDGKGTGVVINFASDDVDLVAERAVKAGAEVVEGPVDRPWNARELVLRDPDGFTLTFSGVIDATRAFKDVMDPLKT